MKKHLRNGFVFLVLVLLAALNGCQRAAPAPKLTPVTVQLKWTHQAQFAGFYAAAQQGYYNAAGLQVTFLEGGPNVDELAAMLTQAAEFSIAGADELLVARSAGKPVRAVAVVYRRNPQVFFARADSIIAKPQDFVNKKIRLTTAALPTLRAMMAQVNIPLNQYTLALEPFDLDKFAAGQVDVSGGYVTNEVLRIQQAGLQLNIIYPDDYGVHFYSDTLFTTDDLIAKNPDLVARFVRATLKGWTFAVENPAQVGALVQKYNATADATLENAKMTASIPLVNTGEDHIGWMKPEMWAGMEKTLREQGVLTAPVDVTQVYTLQFLREIYK
jgi:NitT/TauT family transport system substrate-binding protein